MVLLSSSASPSSVHSRFSIPSSMPASRRSQETSSPPRFPKAFEPHLNYSWSRDALAPLPITGRQYAGPRSRFSPTVNCQPTTVNQKAFEPHLNYSRSRDTFAMVLHPPFSVLHSPCSPLFCPLFPPESPLFATNLHGACLKKRFMLDYIHPYRSWCSLRKSNGRTPGLDPCIAALFRSVRSAGLTGPEYPITHRVTTRNQASSTGNHVRKGLDH
jgi:hypothetical protein